MSATGTSSPLSSTSTLTNSDSLVKDKQPRSFLSPSTPPRATVVATASAVLESLASKYSDSVFVYDAAAQSGLGALTKQWSESGAGAQYVEMQSRHGAGLILAGRLGQSTSAKGDKSGILSAYTSPEGLAQMVSSLASLPPATSSARVVIHVPAISTVGPALGLTPSLASLSTTVPILPENFSLILSATPQETADLAALSYSIPTSHIIHVFDQYASAREVRRIVYPASAADNLAHKTVAEALKGAGYGPFDYHGSPDAQSIAVALKGAFGSVLEVLAQKTPRFGVVTVRVLRPWDDQAFRNILPTSTKSIHVFEDVFQAEGSGFLHDDVFSAVLNSPNRPQVLQQPLSPSGVEGFVSNPPSLSSFLSKIINISSPPPSVSSAVKKLLFYGTPSTSLSALPSVVAQSFMTTPDITARFTTNYDAFSKPGGVSASRIFLATDDVEEAANSPAGFILPRESQSTGAITSGADFLAVTDQSLLKTHDLFAAARPKSLALIFSQWSSDEIAATLPKQSLETIRQKELFVYTMDSKKVAADLVRDGRQVLENVLAHLAFLRLYIGVTCTTEKLTRAARGLFGDIVEGVEISKIVEAVWPNVFQVVIPTAAEEEAASPDAKASPALKSFEFNALELESFRGLDAANLEVASMATWRDAAKHIFFREAYRLPSITYADPITGQQLSLRPDLEDRTFLVTCSVNRRLTPKSYDRNVFHMEFDTAGTGLKYEIGEALGIHGWNDAGEVLEFCTWYGLDPDALVTIPVPAGNRTSADGMPLLHTRTVFQALQQQIDIFGRPPKSFYSALAEHAKQREHRMALRFIGAAEGSATFKKFSEVDTVTFADLFRMYDSARPDFAALCDLVRDIKPRHYSIASAQSAVGDRVDLLVVTVDWVTPGGSPRFGQCTRYLADLRPGQKVTVSIKPSVMKLPPDNMQPIVMAGLGTGAAPFRAFIQHRAHLAAQGIPIGPLVYYFGSRHRSQEYLYGEELEAYIGAGIITHAGFAFSRDQKKKIYIQHKMLEDGKMLADMLAGDGTKGVFYLCGPTWPVPDVHEALLGALGEYAGYTKEDAAEYIESLKEEERYVLEVY